MDRFFDTLNSPMHKLFDFVYRLVVLNLCMIAGTIIGLGLFGIFPSIISATFILKRHVFDHEEDLNIWKEFKDLYIRYFKIANVIFIVLLIFDIIVVFDSIYVYQTYIVSDRVSWFGVFFSMMTIVIVFVVFALHVYLPIAMVFFEKFNIKDALRFSLLSTIGTPLLTIQYVIIMILSYLVFSVFISATPLIGLSLPLYLIIKRTSKRYYKFFLVQSKQGYDVVYYKMISNKERYVDLLRRYVEEHLEHITLNTFQRWCKTQTIHYEYSYAITDSMQQVLGFTLVNLKQQTAYIKIFTIHKPVIRNKLGTILFDTMKTEYKKRGIKEIILDLSCDTIHPLLQGKKPIKTWAKEMGFKTKNNQLIFDLQEVST